MRIEQLKFFVVTANLHSMRATGNSEHTTVQNVSKNIKQLEKELDTILFVRKKSGIYLTDSGETLYPLAVKVLNDVKMIKGSFGLIETP